MADDDQFARVIAEPNGSFSAAYGPFALQSAFQPIYSQSSQGFLKLEAYEALIRPTKAHDWVSPPQFFSLVEPGDGADVERLCRRLHILNAGISKLDDTLLFLNFDPEFFTDYADLLREADALSKLVCKAGLSPSQVVCEIIEKEAFSRHLLHSLGEVLRERNFKIAIDDYGAEDSDFERLEMLKPDIVKFDALWVNRFMETTEGISLLRVMVRQFRDRGVFTLFEGLEEHWQVSLCRELGVRLLQGFALGKPKLAPLARGATGVEERSAAPEAVEEFDSGGEERGTTPGGMANETQERRPKRVAFGRRGR